MEARTTTARSARAPASSCVRRPAAARSHSRRSQLSGRGACHHRTSSCVGCRPHCRHQLCSRQAAPLAAAAKLSTTIAPILALDHHNGLSAPCVWGCSLATKPRPSVGGHRSAIVGQKSSTRVSFCQCSESMQCGVRPEPAEQTTGKQGEILRACPSASSSGLNGGPSYCYSGTSHSAGGSASRRGCRVCQRARAAARVV